MFMMTIVSLILAALVGGATAPVEELKFYPMTTVVVELEEENDTVVCADFNGNEWGFEGIEDWLVGDIASLIMCDNGTPEIEDDIICSVRYDGYLK